MILVIDIVAILVVIFSMALLFAVNRIVKSGTTPLSLFAAILVCVLIVAVVAGMLFLRASIQGSSAF